MELLSIIRTLPLLNSNRLCVCYSYRESTVPEITVHHILFFIYFDVGIDEQLGKHVAHLFIRDPVAVYKEKLFISDENEMDHFENLNSTNYQSVRFKPPPPNSDIGWRVEMRPMEVSRPHFYLSISDLCSHPFQTKRVKCSLTIAKI